MYVYMYRSVSVWPPIFPVADRGRPTGSCLFVIKQHFIEIDYGDMLLSSWFWFGVFDGLGRNMLTSRSSLILCSSKTGPWILIQIRSKSGWHRCASYTQIGLMSFKYRRSQFGFVSCCIKPLLSIIIIWQCHIEVAQEQILESIDQHNHWSTL